MNKFDKLEMQPVTKSELMCLRCEHIYDEGFPLCTCGNDKNIVTWKQFVQHKIETGVYK